MATTGVMNGTKLRAYVDPAGGSTYAALGTSTDFTVTINHAARETTNQDSGGYATFLEGKRSFTIDVNAFYAEDSANNFEDIIGVVADSTKRGLITFKLATATTGDSTLTGSGYITNVTKNSGGPEANVTWSFSIQGTGAWTSGTVS